MRRKPKWRNVLASLLRVSSDVAAPVCNNSQLFSCDEWREEHGDGIELVTERTSTEAVHQLLWRRPATAGGPMDAIESLPGTRATVVNGTYVLPREELNLKEIGGAVLEVGIAGPASCASQAIQAITRKLGEVIGRAWSHPKVPHETYRLPGSSHDGAAT